MHVFTYGTLMFPDIWQTVVGQMFTTIKGTASGYAILRIRDAVFPGITEAPDSTVPGVVYLDVDRASLARLDRFEDDFYERRAVPIDCADGRRLTADTYIVRPDHRDVLTDEAWDRERFVASGGLEQFVARFAGFRRIAGGD